MSDSHFAKPVRDAVDHADGQTFENSPLPPQSPAPVRDKLGSDGGTIVLHWLTVLSMVASLLTGLRISADGINAPWAAGLTALLPQGEIWTWHLVASLVLTFTIGAYYIYVRRGDLGARNGPRRFKTLTPPTNTRLRWRAINVALHWLAYGAIAALTVTGALLYLGHGGMSLTVHRALAWTMLFYILVHTLAHFFYGGIEQLLRLFRPRPLMETPSSKAWPMACALGIGTVVAGGLYAADLGTRDTVTVVKVQTAPALDGVLDDPVWQWAKPASTRTHQGANLGASKPGEGVSLVTTRAVRDDTHIYFAFQWQDPTRSLMRNPLIKKEDGWHVMAQRAAEADVVDYYEDKFAVLFAHADKPGGAGSTFLGEDTLPAHAKSPHRRGMHYTVDGRMLDLWQWKATRGGLLGHTDDMHIGPPKAASAAQKAGDKRYAAGYDADPGKKIYEYNYKTPTRAAYNGPVEIKRLPRDLAGMRLQLGTVPKDADGQNDSGSQWWFTRDNSVPYDPGLDAAIPVGTILPSTLNIHTYAGDRADLSSGAKWKDGVWTLEVARKLDTKSAFDTAFIPGTSLYAWVSVFDHNQIRHTRHQRPITLKIEP
ncbi:MAG: ethylbenzene dehydrogenase-related protein [Pseudomonadota bacterium]